MNPLPAPTAPPLFILPPANLLALLALVVAFLLALLIALIWRLWRRRPKKSPQPASMPPPVPQPSVTNGGLGSAISSLERRTLQTKAFRDGCHALARLIKKHLEQATGLGVEEMTSSEIGEAFVGGVKAKAGGTRVSGGRVGGASLGPFMTGLSSRRFGREEPRRRHFVAACKEARRQLVENSTGDT